MSSTSTRRLWPKVRPSILADRLAPFVTDIFAARSEPPERHQVAFDPEGFDFGNGKGGGGGDRGAGYARGEPRRYHPERCVPGALARVKKGGWS